MKALGVVLLAGLFTLPLLTGCSGDNKDQKTVAPSPTTEPPKDMQPKMIDKKPVGFQ